MTERRNNIPRKNTSSKKEKKYGLYFLYILPFLLILFTAYNCIEYLICMNAVESLTELKSEEYMRIKIYGSSNSGNGNTVSATFSIIDSNGNEIAVIERSWAGSYLCVQFNQISMKGKNFMFPSKIFGSNHILESGKTNKKVTALEKYYNDNGQCMLLGYGSSYKQRQELYKISRFATKNLPVIDFGLKNLYTVDLSGCKTGVYYSILKDSFGNLILQEL